MSRLFDDVHIAAQAEGKRAWHRFSSPAELISHLIDSQRRFDHVIGRLKNGEAANDGALPDRVVNVASRIICGSNTLRDTLRRYLRGPMPYSRITVEPADIIKYTKALPLTLIGHVYFVRSPLRPSHQKIGFTTRLPEVRVRALMANSGEKLELMGSFVGTLLDEQILHCINQKTHVVGEWYIDPKWFPTTVSGAVEQPWSTLVSPAQGARPQ